MDSPVSLDGRTSWLRCVSEAASDRPGKTLRAAAYAMIFLHRISLRKGVQMEHVLERHRRNANQSFLSLGSEEQDFASGVLALPALLLKSSHSLLRFKQDLDQVKLEFPTEGADFFGEFAWSALAQSMHEMKLVTARQCWSRYVRPKREEAQELKRRHEMLQSQFRKVRTAYLHEISALRDELRGPRARSDEASVESADIINLFDPTLSVEPTEIDFFCNAVTEKLKMILEVNPSVAQSCNLSQLQLLLHAKESNEVKELRNQLKSRSNEIAELRNSIVDLQRIIASESGRKKSTDAEPKVMLDAQSVIGDLEDQLGDAKVELRNEKSLSERLRQDLEELRLAYEGEISERVVLQQMLEAERQQHSVVQATAEEEDAGVEQKQQHWAERVQTLEAQLSMASAEAHELQGKLHRSQEQVKRARYRPRFEGVRELVSAGEEDLDLNLDSMPSRPLLSKRSAATEPTPVRRKSIRRHTFSMFGIDTESFEDQSQENSGGLSEQILSKVGKAHSGYRTDLLTTPELEARDVPVNESDVLSEAASLRFENLQLTEELAHLKQQLEEMRRQHVRRKAEEAIARVPCMTEDSQKRSFDDAAPPAIEEQTSALTLQEDLQAARKHCALMATRLKVLLASEKETLPEVAWLQQIEEACQQVVDANWQLRSLEMRLVTQSLPADASADTDALREESNQMRHLLHNLNATCQDMSRELADAHDENMHLVTALERLKSKAGKSVAAIEGSRSFQKADPGVHASLKGFEEIGRNSVFHRLSVSGRYHSQRFQEFRERYLQESSRALMAVLKLDPGAVEEVIQESLSIRPVEHRGEDSRPEPVVTSRHVHESSEWQASSICSQDFEEPPAMMPRSSTDDGRRRQAPSPAGVSGTDDQGSRQGCFLRPPSVRKAASKASGGLPAAARSHLEPPRVSILVPGVTMLRAAPRKPTPNPQSARLPRLEQQSPTLLTSDQNYCNKSERHRSRDHALSPYV
eukprot:TRINITY_DN75330_c0_g1_i1.p1 TRINITY_DN75330_c0_g1~~TRINITY_DN75330_c0_g1_i1.p1  ORF type:complete len:990 (-),score=228.07 TRINITY_DN75330_c0_g1_i1:35-2977(-)